MRVLVDGTLTEPRLDHPEGVAVARDGSVWCGGERGQIYRFADGVLEEVASTGGFILGLAFDAHGDLFVCDIKHGAVFRYRDGLERFAEGFKNPNAIAFDAEGRMYLSDSHTPAAPGIYRYEPDGTGGLWDERPLHFANGIALFEDALYVAETWAHAVVRIAIEPDGSPGERSVVAQLDGVLPDGLAFDVQGRLYVACYEPSQILRVQDGRVEVFAHDPTAHTLCHPTNVAFRGSDLIAANLGRWHLTLIETDTTGVLL